MREPRAAGRIIIGGEDSDEVIEPEARDRADPGEVAHRWREKLAALWPRGEYATSSSAGPGRSIPPATACR